VPSSTTVNTADSQNTATNAELTLTVHGVSSDTDVAGVFDAVPSCNMQSPSVFNDSDVAGSSDCQLSQHADELLLADTSDAHSLREMFASPPPSDCLNDIWLSSAAIDSGSPLKPHGSGSFTIMQCST